MKDIKHSLFSLFAGTLTSFTVWLAIISTVDPTRSDLITIAAFFASLFLWITGLITFISIYLGSIITNQSISGLITNSILQGTIISSAFVILLILQTLNVLDLWETIIIAIIVIITELYLIAIKKQTYE